VLCLEDMQLMLPAYADCAIILFVQLPSAQVTHCLSEKVVMKIHTHQVKFKSQYSWHVPCRVAAYKWVCLRSCYSEVYAFLIWEDY